MARLDPAVPTEKVDGRRAARLLTSHATIARCHRQRGGQARFTFAAMTRSVRGLGEGHDAARLQSKRIWSAFSGHAARPCGARKKNTSTSEFALNFHPPQSLAALCHHKPGKFEESRIQPHAL